MKTVLAVLITTLTLQAHAEYRVFILLLENSKTATTRQIQTTLDPEQYITLYPLNEGENISYVDTWMCKGRTDFFKPHCDKPIKLKPATGALDRSPASLTTQSPVIKN
jgi:hypothetical protein